MAKPKRRQKRLERKKRKVIRLLKEHQIGAPVDSLPPLSPAEAEAEGEFPTPEEILAMQDFYLQIHKASVSTGQ
jgi:hypothetical protein